MVTRYKVKECCGKSSASIKLDKPISMETIKFLSAYNFKELEHFTKNGILYLESKDIAISGSIGANIIGIKCKSSNCDESLDELEKILENMP